MIQAIEEAMVARIATQLSYLTDVLSYQGDSIEDLLGELLNRLPAAAVVFAGAGYRQAAMGAFVKRAQFKVVLAVESWRGEEERRHGDGSLKGTYEVMEDLEAALVLKDLELDITPLEPVEIENLFDAEQSAQALSVFGMTFETEWTVYEVAETAADMTTIHGDYHLKPAESDGPHATDDVDVG